MKNTLVGLFLFIGSLIKAQPSFHVNLKLRMFDSTGTIIDYTTFYKYYELLGEGNRRDNMPWVNENIQQRYFYTDSTNIFNFSGSVVYHPLVRKIVFNDDTMTLLVPFFMNPRSCYIDSLIFQPGEFWVWGDIDYIKTDHQEKYPAPILRSAPDK